jgi:aminopeptidase N
MLRTFLGEDNWWRSINHYLTRYAHQPVETAQFRIAIEETTGQPMDWFFDEWVYKMGHPVFRVSQTYDQTKKELTLKVRQEQKSDPDSQYPQVGFFQTPVDIEIGTATNTRVERVQIEPKEEQTFKFNLDAEPLLVGFDYQGTLIKEVTFAKPTPELVYQLKNDKDLLGRIWALSQLSSRMKDEKTIAAERETIRTAIAEAATRDQFWGARANATATLSGSKESRDALLAATKDSNSTVRMLAVNSLVATKDPGLANAYLGLLNDRSYQVIRAAATALGQTRNSLAYDALVKLIDESSWRDNIRASALTGLAELGDKAALELGFKYAPVPNRFGVRAAALGLLGNVGKDDPRTFPLLTAALNEGLENQNFQLLNAAANAIVQLGDPRGVTALEDLAKKTGTSSAFRASLTNFAQRLKTKLNSGKPEVK